MDTNETRRRRRRPPAEQKRRRERRAAAPEQKPEEKRTRRVRSETRPAADRRRVRKPEAAPKKEPVKAPLRPEPAQNVAAPPKVQTRGRFLLKLGSMAAVVAAVFFCLSLFFRVGTVEIAGAEKYTPHMIQKASGVEEGDALLTVSEARVASRIHSKLPYVDRVKVRVHLPDTVRIELTELQVTYAIADAAGQWWLISSDGRAVEPITEDKAQTYTRVTGLRIQKPEQGSGVTALAESEGETAKTQQEADEHLQTLKTLLAALEAESIIGQVEQIDASDREDLRLHYPSLLTVRLGGGERMEHKVRYMAAALEQLAESTGGLLDISLEYTENAVFTPAG